MNVLTVFVILGFLAACHAECKDKTDLVWNVRSVQKGNTCYAFSKDNQIYEEAESNCMKSGGHLVSILSEEENELLVQLMREKPYYKGDAWIGYDDVAKEGEFRWKDGSISNYTNWADGEGTNHVLRFVEDSAALNSDDKKWHDFMGDSSKPYICEFHVGS